MASVLLMALLNLVYHMQEFMIEPKVKGVPRGRIQKAQAKLFLVMCYYTLHFRNLCFQQTASKSCSRDEHTCSSYRL